MVPATDDNVQTAAVDPRKDFGWEDDYKRAKKEKLTLVADVVRHWENQFGQLVVKLDNGQVWTEVFGHVAQVPKGSVSVEISEGRLGGYRMRINNKVGLIRVKRLE